MPRFAILTHDWPALHWDLLLEDGLEAETWRLLQEPTSRGVQATHSSRHRLHYLTYQGPVSGNRGTVTQWDSGTFEWLSRSSSRIEISLQGQKLRGAWQCQLQPEISEHQVSTLQKTQTTRPLPDQTKQASQTEQVWWFSAAEAAEPDAAEAAQT